MNPKRFDYFAPESLDEAIKILKEKEDAKVLAGGQSLIALMKLRLASPQALVDLNRVQDNLSYIREEKDYLAIGAMTTHDTVEQSEIIKQKFTLLNDAASKIGDQQVRNRGTIGGSCCHADPAADLPTALLALNPTFVAFGSNGLREINYKDFFVDTFTTSLEKDEILTEIRIPYLEPRSCSAYIKHSRREGDFAIVGVGVALVIEKAGNCKDARISLGAVAPTPIRASKAEKYLIGKKLTDQAIEEASERAGEGADPPSDMHGSREYRLDMIKVFTKRAIKLALSRVK
jgi:carbon-monoxide dehydrogenase medium subunit